MSEQNDSPSTHLGTSAPKASACSIVIFGAGGDLTKRLVTPALYDLATSGLLPDDLAIIGVDHSEGSDEEWRESLTAMMQSFVGGTGEFDPSQIDAKAWDWLRTRMFYLTGDFEDPETFKSVKVKLAEVEKSHETGGNVLFYLAVADRFFGTVVDGLGQAGLTRTDDGGPWRRVVIEKPFGHDLASAKALNARVLDGASRGAGVPDRPFPRQGDGPEHHGVPLRQRPVRGVVEPRPHRPRADHRGRDGGRRGRAAASTRRPARCATWCPTTCSSCVAMAAMEPPVSFDADDVRSRKVDVFKSIKTLEPHEVVRGQYGAGEVLGKAVKDYSAEPHVDPHSTTETYVALKLEIDNWRWAGVPFYLRTGKYMTARTSEVAIRFKSAPMTLFAATSTSDVQANWMAVQIQPDEGISLQFEVKRPGPVVDLMSVRMSFAYKDWFEPRQNVGYETLLYDVMTGDQTLFQRADQVEEAWRVVDGVLEHWGRTAPQGFPNYAGGSAGPEAADKLLSEDRGRAWRPVKFDPGPKTKV